jgi:hypothetical protein
MSDSETDQNNLFAMAEVDSEIRPSSEDMRLWWFRLGMTHQTRPNEMKAKRKRQGEKPTSPILGDSHRPPLSRAAHTNACVPFQNRELVVHNVGHPCCPTCPSPSSIPWSLP